MSLKNVLLSFFAPKQNGGSKKLKGYENPSGNFTKREQDSREEGTKDILSKNLNRLCASTIIKAALRIWFLFQHECFFL